MSGDYDGKEPAEDVTPEVFLKVIRGQGTAEQTLAVQRDLRDPHSELNDWLEQFENWMTTSLKTEDHHQAVGDGILFDAGARKDRNDMIAFARRMHAEN